MSINCETRNCSIKGTIQNSMITTLFSLRKNLNPNEKIIVRNNVFYVVQKSYIDELVEKIKGLIT